MKIMRLLNDYLTPDAGEDHLARFDKLLRSAESMTPMGGAFPETSA